RPSIPPISPSRSPARPALRLHMPHIPVPDADTRDAEAGEDPPEALRDHHRAMASARASYGDREIALPLGHVKRHDVLDVVLEALDERARPAIAFHEVDDRPVATGPAPERRHEMRIRKTARVEDKVGVHRHAVLEPEAEQRDDESRAPAVPGKTHEE